MESIVSHDYKPGMEIPVIKAHMLYKKYNDCYDKTIYKQILSIMEANPEYFKYENMVDVASYKL